MFVLRNKMTFKFKGHNCLREAQALFHLGGSLGSASEIHNSLPPKPQAAGLDPTHPRMHSSWLLQAGSTLT